MDLFSGPHLIILLVIVLLLFGPKNLPRLAQSIGQSMRELKKGLQGVGEDLRQDNTRPQNPPPSNGPVPGTQPQNPTQYTTAGTSPAEPVEPPKQA